MNSGAPLQSRAWLIAAMLWIVTGLNCLDRIMITTLRDSLKDVIPMTDAHINVSTLFQCAAAGN